LLAPEPVDIKALWITPDYPSEAFPFAGICQQMQALAVAAKGVCLEIVSTVPYVPLVLGWFNERYKKMAALPRHALDGGIKITRLRYITTPREYVWTCAHITQRVSLSFLNSGNSNLIHAHFAYPVGAAAAAVAKKKDIPLILTLHGDDVTVHPYVSPWHRRRFAKTVMKADFLIAVSETLAIETEKLSGMRPIVLSAGVDVSAFENPGTKRYHRKRLNFPPDAFIILYIGNLLPQKGVSDLARAFSQSPIKDVLLVLVGEGPCKPRAERIICLGQRPNYEIPGFLAAADLLVIPSHHEGLGQVILEAGAAGLPVIGARTGGIQDLLSDERGWMFPPKDVYMLARTLVEVKQNPEEAKRRAKRLKALVMEKHDLKKNADRLKEIYQHLLEEKPHVKPQAKRAVYHA